MKSPTTTTTTAIPSQQLTTTTTMALPPHIMALSKVQRLYDACDVVFSSPPVAPTLGDITWLQNILGQFTTSCLVRRLAGRSI